MASTRQEQCKEAQFMHTASLLQLPAEYVVSYLVLALLVNLEVVKNKDKYK